MQIENIVFIELKRRGFQVEVGTDDNREIGNLVNLPDNYQKTVITANRMDTGEVQGVPIVHIVDWLLS